METEEGIHHRGRRAHREDWEWESDSDGGLGTSLLPFLAPTAQAGVPVLVGRAKRRCAAGESGESCLLDRR
jgi:hypothetical protein